MRGGPQAAQAPQPDHRARQLHGQQRRVAKLKRGAARERRRQLLLRALPCQPLGLQQLPDGGVLVLQAVVRRREEVSEEGGIVWLAASGLPRPDLALAV